MATSVLLVRTTRGTRGGRQQIPATSPRYVIIAVPSGLRLAATDEQLDTRDEARLGRGQERHRAGQLIQRTGAAQRCEGHGLRIELRYLLPSPAL